jgi:hypothetical protein
LIYILRSLRRRGDAHDRYSMVLVEVVGEVDVVFVLSILEEQHRLDMIAPDVKRLKGGNSLRNAPKA